MSTVREQQVQISGRAHKIPASPIRRLAPLADAAKVRGIHVYHLNIGQPDIETPPSIRQRLKELDAKVLEYSPSGGTPEYVKSLQHYYMRRLGMDLDTNQILATTGGSEAIIFTFIACASEGDDVMVVEPFYTNYRSFATMAGLNVVPVTARAGNGFRMPPREEFERALTSRTRILIICNPNNPTGTVYTREEIDMVADFCRDHGLFLVSDEVYREFVYDGLRPVSALSIDDSRDFVVVVDSLSKRYSACGIRLGALVTRNLDVYNAGMRMAQARLSPPGIAQFIAVGAENVGDDYMRDVVKEYQRRRDVLYDGLRSIPGVSLEKPEGAFYCIPRLPIDDADEFAAWLLRDFSHNGATVMVAPATGFYASNLGQNEVRIAYVLNEQDLRASIDLLRVALEKYKAVRA